MVTTRITDHLTKTMTLTEKIAIVNTEMSGTYTTGTTKITETEETLIMMLAETEYLNLKITALIIEN
ncbi:hypothetical protein DPMN_067509 [Dreissena polymorpha]|uniref:Uncharacterized protein n=1 Tax=Dreissena polymorpha TaxID=45954 RepID=A0A9D3YZT5_DREPO|nr:hypothetical protein DPMN_067509 [Dreissena polymorpha]